MLYIKHSTISKEPKAKLLYLMGATWHTKCMFDLETVVDNFSTLLNNQGIETYAFDIVGSGPGPKTGLIGDQHDANIAYAKRIILEHNIDYVMGYSYGALVAMDIINDLPATNLILLDPFTKVPTTADVIDAGDKYVVKKENILKSMSYHGANIPAELLQQHFDALCPENAITTATYPKAIRPVKKVGRPGLRAKVFFTKNSTEEIRNSFPQSIINYYPNTSHWILLEDHRKVLAKDVSEFILQ